MTRNWKPSCRSLDPQVDADHQTLFRLLDEVATQRRESDAEGLNTLLDQLLEHTFEHFAREEALMAGEGYPRLEAHVQSHQALRDAFLEALRQVVHDRMPLPAFIHQARESFVVHFETEDMTYIAWRQQELRCGTLG